jgi:signal transduction histidine kinase
LLNITKQETELPSINNYLDLIEGVIDKQDSFIKEIISFFKNKRTSVFYSQFSLVELIECVVSNNKYAPQAQNIIITSELLADDIYNDELRLKIILNNLISNAIKYSDERKSIRTIDIKTNLVDNKLTIVVEDNGIGIAKEYFTKIFNMFYVASSNNRGTGLGLYILKENVEVLNGNVEVESAINKGTRFTITLPCVQSRQHRKESKTTQNPELAV